PAPTALQITGNVRFAENGKPVGPAVGANVALSGHSGFQTETDRNGNFSLSIPDNQQIQDIELIITYEDKTDYHTVKRSETENIIIRLERTPGHNSGRTKSWFIVENPVLRSDAEMIIKPGKGAAKRFKPLNIEFDEILFSKKGIPVAEKDVKKKSFCNGFSA
ncbi:MAG: carboxypeptidase-like regulatory domain-containing protein, partial [Desulfobacteraceae bacterium]|nr:carboxypeptidase-like regulatory domain-containing protein [Desulfobacteraceae bacterium]